MTVKKLANKRPELTDIEIEDNGGKDLSAYDLKVGRKNTAVDAFGNLTTDKSAVSSGNDISINDLIDFVNSYSEDSIHIGGKKRAVRNSAGQVRKRDCAPFMTGSATARLLMKTVDRWWCIMAALTKEYRFLIKIG